MIAATSNTAVLVELGAVILALAVIARIMHGIGISPVPAYLLAGLAVGQRGVLRLDLSAEFVSLGSEIGVVLLLLTLGLQYTADDLRAGLRDNAAAGVFDAVANFTPGVGAGLLLGWDLRTALVLGGVTYISSSGIIAKTLADLGRLGNRETGPVLSILVLEDLAMAGYLPVMAALVAGASAIATLASLTVAAVTVTVVMFVALRHGSRVSRAVASESDEVLLLTVFGFTLLVAGLAHQAEVSAGVGAFLVGLALSGPVAARASQLVGPLRDLFAATFFFFFGLQIDAGQLPAVLPAAAGLAVLTAATKMGTGWWSARRIGVGRKGRIRAGVALVARGEFSVVIAELGIAAGLEPRLGPLVAGYVLILAICGPLLMRWHGEPQPSTGHRTGIETTTKRSRFVHPKRTRPSVPAT